MLVQSQDYLGSLFALPVHSLTYFVTLSEFDHFSTIGGVLWIVVLLADHPHYVPTIPVTITLFIKIGVR